MTYEEFLGWADEGTRAEWVDGEVILMSPASLKHQRIVAFLATLLQFYVEEQGLGEVLTVPFQMRLRTRPSGREPDVIFIRRDQLHRLHDLYFDGPADLAIEVISTDSVVRDRQEKYSEYEQAGVREYWLIDPLNDVAEFYQLGTAGSYLRMPISDEHTFRSEVLKGLWLRVDWLWQEPLPTLKSILKEWNLV